MKIWVIILFLFLSSGHLTKAQPYRNGWWVDGHIKCKTFQIKTMKRRKIDGITSVEIVFVRKKPIFTVVFRPWGQRVVYTFVGDIIIKHTNLKPSTIRALLLLELELHNAPPLTEIQHCLRRELNKKGAGI